MSAVFTHRWNIGPEIDLAGNTPGDLDIMWKSALGSTDPVRASYLGSLIWNGLSLPGDYLTEFDANSRVMTRQRQFVDAASAQEWQSWIDENLAVSAGGWTRTESTVTDNATLPRTGRYFV